MGYYLVFEGVWGDGVDEDVVVCEVVCYVVGEVYYVGFIGGVGVGFDGVVFVVVDWCDVDDLGRVVVVCCVV